MVTLLSQLFWSCGSIISTQEVSFIAKEEPGKHREALHCLSQTLPQTPWPELVYMAFIDYPRKLRSRRQPRSERWYEIISHKHMDIKEIHYKIKSYS
jgi:hypothetical protein